MVKSDSVKSTSRSTSSRSTTKSTPVKNSTRTTSSKSTSSRSSVSKSTTTKKTTRSTPQSKKIEKSDTLEIKKIEDINTLNEKPKKLENDDNKLIKEKQKRKSIKKIIRTISFSLFLVLTTSMLILSLSIIKTNMVPLKYLVIINGILLLILFGVFLLSIGKTKKKNIIGSFFSILLTTIFVMGFTFINKTNGNLKDFFKEEELEVEYKLIVNKNSNFNSIKDLDKKIVGILRENSVNVKEFLITNNINDVKIYDTLGELTISLGKDVNAIAINNNMFETIKELDKEFIEDTKDIYDFKLKVGEDIEAEEVVEPPKEEESEEKKKEREEREKRKAELKNLQKGNSFIVYISGIDASGGNSAANSGLSDVNMLVVVNPDKNKILLISIPRDYYVSVNGKKDKLTHAGLYGVNTSIKTLEKVFDIKIDYYLKVCFGAVTTFVDDIDGIDVYSDTEFDSTHLQGWRVLKGTNHLTGEKALAYARERYAYSSGDRHRVQNQQDIISAIVSKVSSNSSYLFNFNTMLEHINPYVATNIPYDKIQSIIRNQINTMSSWKVEKYSVDGYNSWNYSASFPKAPSYVMEPNYQTIIKAQDKIISTVKG